MHDNFVGAKAVANSGVRGQRELGFLKINSAMTKPALVSRRGYGTELKARHWPSHAV
jgi:hypothetical protein